ncbi:unnamed protein product [Cuscuta campestris]|uniref:Uncharacterized protein n=1 Tax=Cuscuta campestris TaxID=132261 RepID=A0A484MIM6_9ASTE|nr:unnamed protein product [Cuscuta campestris]
MADSPITSCPNRCIYLRRLSRVAESSQYSLLRSEARAAAPSQSRRFESFRTIKLRSGSIEVPEGHLPVYVGEEIERFVVSAELLNHPVLFASSTSRRRSTVTSSKALSGSPATSLRSTKLATWDLRRLQSVSLWKSTTAVVPSLKIPYYGLSILQVSFTY